MNMQKHFFGFLLLLAAFIAMPKAHAAGFPAFMAKVEGRGTTVGIASNGTPVVTKAPSGLVPGGGWTSAGNYGVAPGAAGAAKVGAEGTVTAGGKAVGVGITGEVAKEAIIGGLIGCASGGVVGCVIGAGVPLATAYMSLSGARVNPTTGALEVSDPDVCSVGPCYEYSINTSGVSVGWYSTMIGACEAWGNAYNAKPDGNYFLSSPAVGTGSCVHVAKARSNGSDQGKTSTPFLTRGVPPTTGTWKTATTQQVRDALYKNNPDPQMVPELEKKGVPLPIGIIQVTGPSEVLGPKTTKINPDGTKEVTQERTPLTYSGDKVTAGPTTKTTTKYDAQGNPIAQTTETTEAGTEADAPKVEEPPPTDTPLPELPKLYTPKYPTGLVGVWGEQKDNLKSTALSQLTSQLMPNVGTGGTCPTMNVNMDFAQWASYGTRNVAPACEVWDWAKLIVIASALLLARRLIFGG